MLIIDKLKQQAHFSDSESKIAAFILNNLPEIKKYTIYDLAEQTYTSVSTVSRLCKKLGTRSFKEFQLNLNSEISGISHFSGRIEYDFPLQNEQDTLDIISKVQQFHTQTLNDTINSLDVSRLEEAVSLLLSAHSIEIFAEANSFSIASNLHNKLIWLEINSNLDSIPGNQFLKAKSLNTTSVVIMISYYGKSNTLHRIADYLLEHDIKFILLTGPVENSLQKKASCQLSVTPAEDKYKKIAPFGSDVALHTLIDILIMLLYSQKRAR